MKSARFTPSPIRPLPYFNTYGTDAERSLARSLRAEFVPKVRRLLPGHHLGCWRHDAVVNFVKRHKHTHPYFVKADIRQFFPGIRHRDAVVGAQLAYRDLLSLDYVPGAFKRRYVPALHAWVESLPLHRGLPLGSALSGVLAPVMLLPMWLGLKRRFGCPLLVYMDDVLICTSDALQCSEVYAYLDGYLNREFDLAFNASKSRSGRFATAAVVFCGWEFAGGYARISADKMEAFRSRIRELVRRYRKTDVKAFVKQLNRKIDGFGHYYKFGDVRTQYRVLDQFLRQEFRRWFARTTGGSAYRREALASLGLRSLEDILNKVRHSARRPARCGERKLRPLAAAPAGVANLRPPAVSGIDELAEIGRTLQRQMTQLLALQRRQVALLTELLEA